MGTKLFDLFFSRKGGLNTTQFVWPRIFVAIILSMVVSDGDAAIRTNRIIFGIQYKWLSMVLYFICLYSIYVLDSKRLKDIGRKTGFALGAVVLMLAQPLFSFMGILFGIILFAYYLWIITMPSKPVVSFMGTRVTYSKMDKLLKNYAQVMEERDQVGHEVFRKRIMETADETINEAKRILATKEIPPDERELLTLLIENAEQAKSALSEEETNEEE
jgi:chromate transport protein ChrA